MRRLCLFSGGFAIAAALYLFLLHDAPGVLLAALAAVCALLFLLRRPLARRAAVCVLGLLAGLAWCRGYEALFLRPFEALSGKTAVFSEIDSVSNSLTLIDIGQNPADCCL